MASLAADVVAGAFKTRAAGRRIVAWLDDVREQKDSILRGAVLLVGGLALVLVGTIVGFAEGRWPQVAAGSLAVTGIVVMFLGFFVYVVPPLLPAK